MQFIEHKEFKTMRGTYKRSILRASQDEFEHNIVRQDDIGRVLLDLLSLFI